MAASPGNPTQKKEVPAEIVPPKATGTAPAGSANAEPSATAEPLSPGSKAVTERAAPSQREAVDALTEPELDQIISLLKQRYLTPGALSEAAVKRATVQGLLERLGASATLLPPGATSPAAASAFHSELLAGHVGYLRLGAFNPANLAALDQALADFAGRKVDALIVDLRATPASGDFERAAEVARRFCPKGKVLFTLKRSDRKQGEVFTTKDDPRLPAMLSVLTDRETAGSAEIVAGTLRVLARAVIIGQRTKGAAADFAEFPLQAGRKLRLAVAEVLLPGDQSVVPQGVEPDVPVEASAETESWLMTEELEKGVTLYVSETERIRLNEAALVAGTNPELDAMQAAQGTHAAKPKASARDAILQRALDLITTVAVLESSRNR